MWIVNPSDRLTRFFLWRSFGSTVFGESEKGYFGSYWSLQWQRNYPQIKTRRKLYETLLCELWIHLTWLHFLFMAQCTNTVLAETENGYLGAYWGLWWERNYPQIKKRKKFSEKMVYGVLTQLMELHDSFHRSVW